MQRLTHVVATEVRRGDLAYSPKAEDQPINVEHVERFGQKVVLYDGRGQSLAVGAQTTLMVVV
jgi:hypothetical protein